MKHPNLLLILISFILIPACNPSTNKDASSKVKVMTYNIRYDNPEDKQNNWNNRKVLISEVIKKESPDIIGIQEALRHQLDDLAKLLPEYYWVGVGRDDGRDAGEFSPIFYKKARFKKFANDNFWLSETPDTVSKGWDAACKRICTFIKMKDLVTDKIIMTFNTHLDHQGKTSQIESAKLLMRKIHWISEEFPFVLTGDFNITENSEAYSVLNTQVDYFKMLNSRNVTMTKPYGNNATFNGFNKNYNPDDLAIDHIFVRNETTVYSHKTIDTLINSLFPSDHFPVVIEVEFNNALN